MSTTRFPTTIAIAGLAAVAAALTTAVVLDDPTARPPATNGDDPANAQLATGSGARDRTPPPSSTEPTDATTMSLDTTDEPADSTVDDTDAPTASPSDRTGLGDGARLDGAWSTDGARLVDGDGDEVRIRGVNWFGFETAVGVPHGLWSRNMGEMLDQIAELGFNVIRVPFSASIIDDGAGPVEGVDQNANPDLVGLTSLEVLDRFVAEAGARGLGIILDRHTLAPDDRHHLWYDEQYPPERLTTDWEFLAERYRDVPNVIGADLYNEPHDEACWGCGDPAVDWKAAATGAADALHRIEPDWLIFVEGVENAAGDSCDGPAADACTWWGGDLSLADTDPVELAVPNKVVYSPHEYATSVFRQPWFDDPAFPANLPGIWERFWGDLELADTAPVMVGEFGTTLDAEVDAVWLETLLTYLDDIGAGFTFWTFNPNSGDTGGILEDDWTTVDEEKLAYLEPYLLGPFDPVG